MMMLQNPDSHLECLPIGGLALILAGWSVVILMLQNPESHLVGMVVACFLFAMRLEYHQNLICLLA